MRLPSAEARSTFMNSNPVDPIAIAIQEDIGEGDVTTEFFVPAGLHASAPNRCARKGDYRRYQRRPPKFFAGSIQRFALE